MTILSKPPASALLRPAPPPLSVVPQDTWHALCLQLDVDAVWAGFWRNRAIPVVWRA